MKHLRQYIRSTLQEMLRVKKRKVYPKEERGKGMVTKLKPNETASIEYRRGIYYVRIKNESRTIADMELSPIGSDSHWLDWWTGRECLDEYSETYLEVGPEKSQADHGYGPLMYDIALEYAYQIGTGIVPDRSGVSNAAGNVWKHYREKRPDVRFIPFDKNHPCFYHEYDIDRPYLNGAYYKPNRQYLDSLRVKTP